MVFAVWAARKEFVTPDIERAFLSSCRFGMAHIEEIVCQEAAPRGFSEVLAREYLTHSIRFEFGEAEYRGLDLFLRSVAELNSSEAVLESTAC
jgi:chorismate dehydratase